MSISTPIGLRLKNTLDAECQHMQNTWFFKWRHIGGAAPVEIEGFDGGMIHYTGVEFSGSAQIVYWSTIQRYAKKKVQELFDNLEHELKQYPVEVRAQSISESESLIRHFIDKIRKTAIENDRILRGNGHRFPSPYDKGRWAGAQDQDIKNRSAQIRHIYYDIEVSRLVKNIKSHVDLLPARQSDQILITVEEIEKNPSKMKGFLKSIQTIVEGTASNVASTYIQEFLKPFLGP
ncbi:hypothetical protein Gxy13693_020_001 [Komagataeibacter xylinus NBRC 13693]|uniref:Uncharacterized protein n=1 Tax=Komagataeibacter xylinus NBRC 13693 TaxID=1234668 RepID=A0A0D6Q7L1_KOMXY|nr:hypothetical protein [Komagataeibacter xylinus]GAN99308.1 hypothetical protein Gxy13693_020_001 [Komagataeibacter xylinus NBRC 13693]